MCDTCIANKPAACSSLLGRGGLYGYSGCFFLSMGICLGLLGRDILLTGGLSIMTFTGVDDLMKQYVGHFFSGESLKHILIYMCNECTSEIADPITQTVMMFVNTPISLCLTNIGLAPFRERNMSVYPYSHMTPEQQLFLSQACTFMQERMIGFVSTQMGGGCVVSLGTNTVERVYCSVVDVISVLCESILMAKGATTDSRRRQIGICNVIMQRISMNMNICRDDMKQINEICQEYMCQDGQQGVDDSERVERDFGDY